MAKQKPIEECLICENGPLALEEVIESEEPVGMPALCEEHLRRAEEISEAALANVEAVVEFISKKDMRF